LTEIGLLVYEKKLSVFFPYFINHPLLEKGVPLHLNSLETPLPTDDLSKNLVEIV
jgi:hypothetical protein